MKKFVVLLLQLFGAASMVQAQQPAAAPVYVYGIDFSAVQVFGAEETDVQFLSAFNRINELLLTEPQKYDFHRMLGGRATDLCIEPMIEHNNRRDFTTFRTGTQQVRPLDVAEAVRAYRLPQTEGTGLALIARLLDKSRGEAVYEVVLFDVATREVLHHGGPFTAKAGGFGLRNFWASPVYRLLKSYRIGQ